MKIGAGRLVLDFYNNDQVRKKRQNLESLLKDLKKKFNLSILEVADFDDPERCVIGFALVIPETWKTPDAAQLVERVCKTIDDTSFARLTVQDTEILDFN